MIYLEDIFRNFTVGEETIYALRQIHLFIGKGEYVTIMGPSGSGKSTLLNIIALLDHPSSGRYRLHGQDVTELSDNELAKLRREHIGFVFQFFHLVPRLTAAENIELPMVLAGTAPQERKARVQEALRGFGLTDRADHRPDQLSGGQRQRVAIARATIMRPEILLADEPTGNLDQATGREVIHLLEELNRGGMTLIIVTHEQDIAERSHRRVQMLDGRIAADRQAGSAR